MVQKEGPQRNFNFANDFYDYFALTTKPISAHRKKREEFKLEI